MADKKKQSQLTNEVETFIQCSPFIIKTIDNMIIKLRNTDKEIKPEILSLLVINVERLFLLRGIFSLQSIQMIENLPVNL